VAEVEPAALVHGGEEPPHVLDVRVAEGEVVVAPVHPLAEPLRSVPQVVRRPDDGLAALRSECLEPVLLDLALRVEAELALDADLDPEALAVEAVLIALVEAAQRLVALEDILERPAPGGVDAERLVRRDRPVEEREPRPAGVLLPQLPECPFPLPELENALLEPRMVGHRRQILEDLLSHREAKSREGRSYLRGIGYSGSH
jgi:hypothetical protein